MSVSSPDVSNAPAESNETILLNGVTVVDTRTGELLPGMAVVLKDGIIQEISIASESSSGRVIEATGKFLVPGFNDMHAHLLEDKRRDLSLNVMLAYGVTGWRQMNGSPDLLAAREAGELGLTPHGPELLEMPGQILTPSNAASPLASAAEVRRQAAQGADFIKTIFVTPPTFFASLRESTKLGLGYAGHLSLGVSAESASRAGMRAIEHLGPLEMQLMSCSRMSWLIQLVLKLTLAIKPPHMPDLSPDQMETVGKLIVANPTLFRLQMDPKGLSRTKRLIDSFSEEKCRRLARVFVANGTWQVPTLIRIDTMQLAEQPRFANDPNLRYISQERRKFWVSVAAQFAEKVSMEGRETLERLTALALRMTKIFDECGVKMLAGSDYGGMWVIPGHSLHQEFDLLARAGLSPLRVLQMTTLDGAEFLSRQSTMGTVEVGKAANLVLLDGDPIESVENLHRIHAVVRAGAYYSHPQLENLKENSAHRLA